jgi:hypothetical protein
LSACALPTAVCLLLTHSRTGILASAVGLLLLAAAYLLERRPQIGWKLPAAVASAGAMLIVAVLVLGLVNRRAFSAAAKSLGYRLQYWQSSARMIAEHPITGCGPGNFRDVYTRYMLPQASEEIAEPHNFLMEVWATAGTPAVLALVGVLGGFAWAVFRAGRAGQGGVGVSSGSPGREEGRADALPQVMGGAACGFLLALPIGGMSSGPPGLGVLLVGFPLASVAVALLWGWMEAGRLTLVVPAVGVVVLLVNLLAAGGIGFPGVAGTLWLLMAVGLSFTDAARAHVLPRAGAAVGLGVIVVVLLAGWASGFNPVVRSQTAMRLAELALAARDPKQADEHWKAAAAADPLSVEPPRLSALLAFQRWTLQGSDEAFEEFESCMQAAVELAPESAEIWRVRGVCYWKAFCRTGRDDDLQGAVRAHRRAVELYPTSAVNRANLAIALQAAGNQGGFREQATIALRLDEGTPHSDKKLDDNLRDELRRGLSRSSS